MARVRFAIVCDRCRTRGPEYDASFAGIDDECGREVCAECTARVVREGCDGAPDVVECVTCAGDFNYLPLPGGLLTTGYVTRAGCSCRAGVDEYNGTFRVLSADPCPTHRMEYDYHRGQTYLREYAHAATGDYARHPADCRCFHCEHVRAWEQRELSINPRVWSELPPPPGDATRGRKP